MVLDVFGEKREIPKKYLFEFDNKRKMMSVILEETKQGKTYYKLLCKGADSAILSRLSTSIDQPYLSSSQYQLEEWSKYGLRTLCMAMKILSKEEMEKIVTRLTACSLSAEKEKMMEDLMGEVEKDLFLLGCSAVEDRLQDEVPETIARLLEASKNYLIRHKSLDVDR
jgi:magnesium-transporting ATPase (P-type)